MSGIAGLASWGGHPVDPEWIHRAADFMAMRGPDGRQVWIGESAVLAHALLRTTSESARERQPLSFEGQVWLAADARIDARDDLIGPLRNAGRSVPHDVSDADLILHAYHAWGEGCVTRLAGDFAFAIWDNRRRLLLCARDQFGLKPLYYSHKGDLVVFSNTSGCVLMHPDVSQRIDRLALADFLMFGYYPDLTETAYK